jgi:hypothetical protein
MRIKKDQKQKGIFWTYYLEKYVLKFELIYLDHGVDIALRPGELGRVLDLDQHNEVEVMPHVVLALDVLLEADSLVVER